MALRADHERQTIIDLIRAYFQKRLPKNQAILVETFAQRYLSACAVEDLKERSIDDLCGALLSQWQFIYQRKPGESKVKVFNPYLETDHWQSQHTIVQISHDDIPFLVDSARMELDRMGYQVHFLIHMGGLKVKRDARDRITDILPVGAVIEGACSEAPIYLEIDRIVDAATMEELRNNIEHVLGDVRLAVADWRNMIHKMEESISELESNPPPLDHEDIAESKDFLRWLISNNFTLLGCRDYKLIGDGMSRALQMIQGSGLGVLRDKATGRASRSYAELPPQARKIALSKNILIIAKTHTKSTVHHPGYTDYVGVKRFNDQGELIGERRFIGLYTSSAYHSNTKLIPFVRHKVVKVLEDLHFPPNSHDGKEVAHILETLPRDDLFQASHEELTELTLSILQLQERKRIRLFVRQDAYGRYFSCLVYVPREIFTTDLSLAMQDVLSHAFGGLESNFTTYFSDSVLARIHYSVRVDPHSRPHYEVAELEQQLIEVARSWSDDLKTRLIQTFGEAEGLKYFVKYKKAFPASYTESCSPLMAVEDIRKIETLSASLPLGMSFIRDTERGAAILRFKLFYMEQVIVLSDVLPTLEHMGLRVLGERPHEIKLKNSRTVWINDFDLIYASAKDLDIDKVSEIFQETFAKVWDREIEDDGFNRLVFEAYLLPKEIAVLRAYTKYLRQIGFTFSQSYIEQALINNAGIASDLIELFKLRFSPLYTEQEHTQTTVVVERIEQALDQVQSLDEDRILRRMLELIQATLRTNFFQKQTDALGHISEKSYISFKFKPAAISDLPLPRPMFEIFVYSPRVEGVHLRGGKAARGGIRWSDRREDFRTEILGLMKAQQVKNALIVPVGAKGGFYPKQLPVDADRDEIQKEAIYCYSTFIRGLLDLTDNIKGGKIISPSEVVRYDEDDTYLVVAADKGTATFSDIANSIAKEYEFWMGDAFASGGSAGYDHKKMGITAKGAWVSVRRHFRELGLDSDTDDFTMVGIGDMAGDVFGNGLLLSKHAKLVAAFNNVHIFLDPNPDPAISFEERQRLFNLPRSTWMDYKAELISKGGGVYNRSAKSIMISSEIQAALGIKEDHLVPSELIRAILKAPVDLIWNGGIGTFVKSNRESHLDVGDKMNDMIRVDGCDLNARAVGEGGNLGFTQLGRIEYALHGGIINTDFIDNSAGVDCSDHEVNIKILLNALVMSHQMSLEARNQLLEKMTDEVATLVLRDNYEQTQILGLESSVSQQTMDIFRRYMLELEKRGRLDRKLEFLPDDKTILERKANNKLFTRPEIAVLLSYCKLFLKQDILTTDLPEEPYLIKHLTTAFPKLLCEKYFPEMKQHPLRREIIATQLSKSITDHMGINFVERLQGETGSSIGSVVRAYTVAESIFRLESLWQQIEALDDQVDIETQQYLMLQLYYLVRRSTRWFLRNRKPDMDIEKTIEAFTPPITELVSKMPQLLPEANLEMLNIQTASLIEKGVPESLANRIACCNTLFTALDIVEASRLSHFNLEEVAQTYYLLGNRLDLVWLRDSINSHELETQWGELSRSSFRDDLDRVQRNLTINALLFAKKKMKKASLDEKIDAWLSEQQIFVTRWNNLLADIRSSAVIEFVTYSVLLRELFDFVELSGNLE